MAMSILTLLLTRSFCKQTQMLYCAL